MTENEIRKLCEQWVEAWNAQDWEAIKTFYTEDVVLYQAPMKKTLKGIDFIKSRFEDFNQMTSDARFSIRELTIAEDKAVLEFNMMGTNDGPFLEFEPTGQKFDIDGCLAFEFYDSKISKHTTYLDTATILRAVGLIEIPGVRPEAA